MLTFFFGFYVTAELLECSSEAEFDISLSEIFLLLS
jgi:hypothetical protein